MFTSPSFIPLALWNTSGGSESVFGTADTYRLVDGKVLGLAHKKSNASARGYCNGPIETALLPSLKRLLLPVASMGPGRGLAF